MFGRLLQGKQRFFVNSQEIPGIQSLTASFQTNSSPLTYLGVQNVRSIPNGNASSTVGINRYVLTQDYFIGLTGQTGFNGYILNERNSATTSEKYFSFYSGYMTAHRLNIGLDTIPQTTTTFTVYNKYGYFFDSKAVKNLTDIENYHYNEYLKTPTYWTTDVTIDNDFSTNRIQSLDLNINIPYTPLYSMGNRYPKKVEINYPIDVTCTFRVEIDQMRMDALQNYPMQPNKRNISLLLRSIEGEQIACYNFNNMELISENYNVGVGQYVTLDGSYRCDLGRP